MKMFSDKALLRAQVQELGYRDIAILEHPAMARSSASGALHGQVDAAIPGLRKRFLRRFQRHHADRAWDIEKKTGRLEAEIKGVPGKCRPT